MKALGKKPDKINPANGTTRKTEEHINQTDLRRLIKFEPLNIFWTPLLLQYNGMACAAATAMINGDLSWPETVNKDSSGSDPLVIHKALTLTAPLLTVLFI